MANLGTVTKATHVKGAGATYNITIPAARAGETISMYVCGGAVPTSFNLTNGSGPAFVRQTPPYSGGTQDTSIWDVTAVGGETVIRAVLGGDDNVNHTIYPLGTDIALVGASNAGSGAATSLAGDFQIKSGSVVAAVAPTLVVCGFSVDSTATYNKENRFRSLGPAGHIYDEGGNQPGNGGVNLVHMSGLMEVDDSHSWPEQDAAGHYSAMSTWLGTGTCYAAQVNYEDTSGVATNPVVNDTVRENSLPGTHRSNWFLSTGTNATICGFTDVPNYAPGDTVDFFVDSTGHAFQVEIYRTGYYGDENFSARNVLGCQGGYLTGSVVTQPTPNSDLVTMGTTDCSNWTSNASWTVPSDAVSGQYYVLFRRTDDTTKVCSLDFIVSGDPTGKVAVCLPDMTRHAYNPWGGTGDHGIRGVGTYTGNSLYQTGADGATANILHRAYAVDVRRPNAIVDSQSSTYFFDSEQGTATFMEAQGYDLCYLSNWDLDTNPTLLNSAKLVFLLGHHEYWTTNVYDCILNAKAAGVNLHSQGANMAGWRVRFDSTDTGRFTIICYKESETQDDGKNASLAGTGFDPGDSDSTPQYTGSWRDTRSVPGGVNNPDIRQDEALFGQKFIASGPIQTTFTIPFASKTKPIWRHSTAIQALTSGTHYTTLANNQGFECDFPSGGVNAPTNLVNLNPYTASFTTGADDNGSVYGSVIGPITLGFTLYRDASGALVFHTGVWRGWWTVSRWQGGAFVGNVVDVNMQNAFLAVMYDQGVRPTTLTALQPGVDTDLTDPATGAPPAGNGAVARAYGLKVPVSSAALLLFLS